MSLERWARLLGIRTISDDGTTVLIRVPRWITGNRLDARLRELEAEAVFAGMPVEIERVGRLVKLTRLQHP